MTLTFPRDFHKYTQGKICESRYGTPISPKKRVFWRS